MKILVLADEADPKLWEHLDKKRLEGIELIISCGDLPADYLSFLTCFTHAPILYVHGNHDTRYAERRPEGCICIDGKFYIHESIRIVGLGGSMRYRPDVRHQYTEREQTARARRLSLPLRFYHGFDILVAHAPAFGVGDGEDNPHRGFKIFLKLIERYHPAYLLHGHVHAAYTHDFRPERRIGSTIAVNACGSYVVEVTPKGAYKKNILLSGFFPKEEDDSEIEYRL